MKKILVSTDFSAAADNAIAAAINLSRVAGAEIIFIHVLESAAPVHLKFPGPGSDIVSIFRDQAEQQHSKQQLLADHNKTIKTRIYQGLAPVYQTILQASEEQKADLIVMGTKGAGKIMEKLWRSQTASVIGNSPVPVLAVPIEYRWKNPIKVLLATNHFEKDFASCQLLANFIDIFGAILNVVVFTNDKKDKAVTAVSHNWDINRYREFLSDFFDRNIFMERILSKHLPSIFQLTRLIF